MDFLVAAKRAAESPNTLTVLKWIDGFDIPIQISFFGGLRLGQIKSPDLANNGIFVASILDLFGMKCATVVQRAEAKDYIDIYTIINNTDLTLEQGLGAARAIYGEQYNAILTLKALSFFNDGNVKSLPDKIKRELSNRVEKCNLDNVPNILPTMLIGDISNEETFR